MRKKEKLRRKKATISRGKEVKMEVFVPPMVTLFSFTLNRNVNQWKYFFNYVQLPEQRGI